MAKEPASIRYRNPGAMWGSPLAIKWGADKKAVSLKDGTGQNNNIAVFPTYVQGICAQLDLWRTSKHYRNKRFSDAIAIWSGHNNVESYIAFVLKRVPGMTRNTVMDDEFWRSPMGISFLKAQAWHEAGKPYPAPDADWIEAQRRVFGESVPPPDVEPVQEQKPKPKPLAKSKTIWGGIWGWLTGVGGAFFGLFDKLDNPYTLTAFLVIVLLASIAAFLVIKGRIDVNKIAKRLSEGAE